MTDYNLQLIQETFTYDPASGKFTWRLDRPATHWKQKGYHLNYLKTKAGKEVEFTVNAAGYLNIWLNNTMQYAQRIAYVLMTGEYPEGDMDHINGIRADNRWENLRDVSHKINNRNMVQHKSNSSGFAGVSLFKRTGKWRAYVKHDGDEKHLGYFPTAEEAHQARQTYLQANPSLGFTERHGTECTA